MQGVRGGETATGERAAACMRSDVAACAHCFYDNLTQPSLTTTTTQANVAMSCCLGAVTWRGSLRPITDRLAS